MYLPTRLAEGRNRVSPMALIFELCEPQALASSLPTSLTSKTLNFARNLRIFFSDTSRRPKYDVNVGSIELKKPRDSWSCSVEMWVKMRALAVGFHLYNLSINFRPEASAFGSQSECHWARAVPLTKSTPFEASSVAIGEK